MDKKSRFLHIISPLLLLLICTGTLIIAMIKPADKLKVFVNIAFMDSLRSDPTADDSGLVIRENEIVADYSGETSDEGEPLRPSFGELYATVSSDAFGLEIPIFWGSNSELLERGACQSSGSAVFGTDGNSVVSAHVDTFFADLDKLKEGDTVIVKTNYGQFTYTVSNLVEFSKDDRKYITPKNDTRLTLYTCKKDLLGASGQRVGAICTLSESIFYKEAQK